jgi:molybdate/tungstate transport system permease protein
MRALGAVAGLLVLAFLGPVVALAAGIRADTAAAALGSPAMRAAVGTSLASSLLAIGLAAACGIPAAYALARARGPLRALGLLAAALPLGFPPVAVGVMLLGVVGTQAPLGAFAARFGITFVDAFPGVVLAEWYVAAPFVVIAAAAAFQEIDPHLEEAARSLGASTPGVFARVAVPLALPSIAAGVLLGWLRALGEYGATAILAYHPTSLPVALSVVLAADGLAPALAVAGLFVVTTTVVLTAQALIRRRVL